MKHCAVDMPSYTFAIKAQKLLKARGYSCEIKRNQNSLSKGCGYFIKSIGNCQEISELLKKYSIPFEHMRNEVE